MEISLHGLTDGPSVIGVARKLKRENAYDATVSSGKGGDRRNG